MRPMAGRRGAFYIDRMHKTALVLLIVSLAASAARASDRAVVPARSGYPRLTQQMLDRSSAMIAWAPGVELSPSQRAKQQGFIIEHWKQGDAEGIGGMLELMDL